MLELIDEAAADGREVFRPPVEHTAAQRAQPRDLAADNRDAHPGARHLVLHGSPADPAQGPPDHVIADKGYSTTAIRGHLREHGISHTIPERADQRANCDRRGSNGGRPPAFDPNIYRHRNVVELLLHRLKRYRGIATRYDKDRRLLPATITIAALLQWL